MHFAIYLSSHDDKTQLIEQLKQEKVPAPVKNTQGGMALYSKLSLECYLREEYQHDRYVLTEGEHKPLALLSEGEQKKALLNKLLRDRPETLIVDDVFDNLDSAAQQQIAEQMQQLAEHTQIIQLFTRLADKLSFIETVYRWQAEAFVPFTAQALTLPDIELPKPLNSHANLANPLIQLNQIHVAFGDKAVINNLSWTVNKGDFWQLMGPNGSGKSTILRMITGDNPKGFGQDLHLFGIKKGSGESVWEIKRYIGYFTHAMTLHFSRRETVEAMLLSGLFDSVGLYQTVSKQKKDLAKQWLQAIGLADKAKQLFHTLSIGHQRLLLVARAMIKQPPLLILDEPTAGLDDEDAQRVVALVNALAKNKETAIIFVSHRHEQGLNAKQRLQLIPSEKGSEGVIVDLD